MKLKEKLVIKGKLKVETGLHIGGTKETFQIGGVDNPVIKIKRFGKRKEEPYIPGSSLKGKIRSLLERKKGNIQVIITYLNSENKSVGKIKKAYKEVNEKDFIEIPEEYNQKGAKKIEVKAMPCKCGKCEICTLFGSHDPQTTTRPTVLIFRDAYLVGPPNENLTEIKTENVIDRVKGTAEHPRQMERVIPGTEFNVEIILNVYEVGDVGKLLKMLKEGFELLQDDYLGGSGTRGYGKVNVSEIIGAIKQELGKLK